MIHLYASLDHYAQHLWPIWQQLPDQLRGATIAPRAGCWWGTPQRQPAGPVLVAGLADANHCAPATVVLVEHGAGQSYVGSDSGSYAGGAGLDRAILFIAPNQVVADRWRARYPDTPVAVVGCPKLDPWHAGQRHHQLVLSLPAVTPAARQAEPERTTAPGQGPGGPVVALTFHWDCQLLAETRSALNHYRAAIPGLVAAVRAAGGQLVGHGHPRAYGALRRTWRALGVPHTEHLADVLDGAHLLIGDNTSALFEFASLDRPVLALNAPWYRRDVEHGLRFWSHVPGLQCDEPADLVPATWRALADPPEARALRERATTAVYAHRDGQAGWRAAQAIVEVLSHAQPQGRQGPAAHQP